MIFHNDMYITEHLGIMCNTLSVFVYNVIVENTFSAYTRPLSLLENLFFTVIPRTVVLITVDTACNHRGSHTSSFSY
jgi:hypothetical protein